MGELGLNKIFGGLLAVALAVLGLREVSYMVFGGGHHHSYEYESVNEWAKKNFAYYSEMTESDSGGEVVEEVYDLGLLLAGADLSAGERNFNAQCKTCHTIEQGGNNGTGPNLYGIMDASKGQVAGFGYSGALDRTEGTWSYENMDNWLRAPSNYAPGTSMAFAGLRRDPQRASVLAYLASFSPDASPFPEPLPAIVEEAEAVAGEAVLEATADLGADGTGIIEASTEDIDANIEAAQEAVEEAADSVVEETTEN